MVSESLGVKGAAVFAKSPFCPGHLGPGTLNIPLKKAYSDRSHTENKEKTDAL
jgi:hypothetical protein